MSDLAGEGPISEVIDAFMALLSNCESFQDWTNTTDAAGALARIFSGQIGTPVKSLSVTSGVLTVVLSRPMALEVGQLVTLGGHDVGAQGSGLAGTWPVLTIDDALLIPWTDLNGNVWTDDDGNPWQYESDEVLGFTATINAPDRDAFLPDGAVLLPCPRPLAAVSNDKTATRSTSVASGGGARISGALNILLHGRTSLGYRNNEHNAQTEADSAAGKILQELSELSGRNEFILLREVNMVMSPAFIDMDRQDSNVGRFEIWDCVLSATWGFA